MSILDKIVKSKKEEVSIRKKHISESILMKSAGFERKCHVFSDFILSRDKNGIIAEFKRKSPSKPAIHPNADVQQISTAYFKAGASALSVLTDTDFFGGSSEDLIQARANTAIPVLRKDFIIEPYQIVEAKSIGADAILLIAEILSQKEIKELSGLARELGMEILMEIHSADQLTKYHENIRNVGINNRDLKNFTTDVGLSLQILPKLPQDVVKISESGLDNPQTVDRLKKAGFDGFLIGEHFMKSKDPGNALRIFCEEMRKLS